MTTLKDSAMAHSGKKELYNIDKIPVDIELQEGHFPSKEKDEAGNTKQIAYKFIEVDGYKYTVRAKDLQQMQNVLTVNPTAKYLKFQKMPNGEIYCIPLL